MKKFVILVLFLALVFGATLSVSQSQIPKEKEPKSEDFFRRKTIKLIVDSTPGSASDLAARVVQPYLAKRLEATVVIVNMSGAGNLEGPNYVWRANSDGLTLGITRLAPGVASASVLKMPGCLFGDTNKFCWIGCTGVEEPIFWTSPSGRIKSIAGLKETKGLKFTGIAKTEMLSLWAMSIAYWFDLDAKVITGLSVKDTELLVIRGEADGSIISPTRLLRGEKAGTHKGLCVMTATGKRISVFPDLPEIREVVALDEEKMKYCKMATSLLSNNGKSLYAPPGMSPDRLQFLRETFTWITHQEDFNHQMQKLGGWAPTYKSGEELQTEAAAIHTNKEYLVQKFNFLMARYSN